MEKRHISLYLALFIILLLLGGFASEAWTSECMKKETAANVPAISGDTTQDSEAGRESNMQSLFPTMPNPLIAYDYSKCIESCDIQYNSCINRGNGSADWIAYCSRQHDLCRNNCLQDR